MNLESLQSSICESMHKQWEFTAAPKGGVRVRTPYMYPDGGILDLFVLEHGDRYRVTDFGETVAWLKMRTGWAKLPQDRRDQVDDICQTHGVASNHGQLELSGLSKNDLSQAVVQLAGVAARVSDLWFTFPRAKFESPSYMAEQPLCEQVEEWFREWRVAFKPRTTRSGRSGRNWSIDYEATVKSRRALIFLLGTRDRREARRRAEHVLVACVDLSRGGDDWRTPLVSPEDEVVNVSLFDDTHDVWREEDIRLLEIESNVVHRSEPEKFERVLCAA